MNTLLWRMRLCAPKAASGRRRSLLAALICALGAMMAFAPGVWATTGAVSTTTNPYQDNGGAGTPILCLNGGTNANTAPAVNCNIYTSKSYVWLSGLPLSASLGAGEYFFAVLDPGGQRDPNDGTAGNLSCSNVSTDCPGGTWDARAFNVDSVGNITAVASTTHTVAPNSGTTGAFNEINLAPYDDTANPGGVYIAAVCAVPSGASTGSAGDPGVKPSACKYDAFKVETSGGGGGGGPASAPTVIKDASGSYIDTYTWGIQKTVDHSQFDIPQGGSATPNYTVTVTRDGGTISSVMIAGTIQVFNPNTNSDGVTTAPMTLSSVTDQLSGAATNTCAVDTSNGLTLSSFETDYPYTCTLSSLPTGEVDNTATVTWADQSVGNQPNSLAAGTATFTFTSIAFSTTNVDDCVTLSDTLYGTLNGGNPICATSQFPYSLTFSSDPPGTCTTHPNTATFTTDTSKTTGSASQSVTVCVGADLGVSKTASTSFTRTYAWSINKTVDKSSVDQSSGSVTLNYKVTATETGFTDSAWRVSGTITVTNPNDWEAVTANITDSLDSGSNGACSVTGGTGVSVPASQSVTVPYTCTYSATPSPASGTNTGTATWDGAGASTPDGSATGTASYAFGSPTSTVNRTITVQDAYNGGSATTLGTLSAVDTTPFTTYTWSLSKTVTVQVDKCITVPNTGSILETGQTSSVSTQICGGVAGGLTMGFWQNKNGQAIISGGASTSGVCNSGTWLRQYAPFQDLSATASCSAVATYVYNIIKAANASGSSMNAMLKAQMLATALDVYFSDPALGGNKINAPQPLGGVKVDLTKICHMIDSSTGTGTCSGTYENVSSAFGGASELTVSQMLAYAASQSNVGGSTWYANNKATQGLAKDAFDAINNGAAFAGP